MSDDLFALYPRCIVCARYLGAPEFPLRQLQCMHVICIGCSTDLKTSEGTFKCPLDGCESNQLFSSAEVETTLQQVWASDNSPGYEGLKEHLLKLLSVQVNYKDVPCFTFMTAQPCSSPKCPYVHGFSPYYQQYQCPGMAACPRKQFFCLFAHPNPEEPRPVFDGQTSIRYSQPEPSALIEGVSLPPHLTGVSKQVTHSMISKEAALFSTIQRRSDVSSGYIYLQSLSLYRFLTDNQCAELDQILGKYQAKAQLTTLKVIRKKSINWSYFRGDGTSNHFTKAISEQLEQAFKAHSPEVPIDRNCVVNLKLMIKVYMNKAYTHVHRTETIVSTSHAASMELLAPPEKYDIINKEIQTLEGSMLVPDFVPGNVLEEIIDEFGLAVNQDGWLFGVKSDLVKASKRLKSVHLPSKTSHLKLKPSINKAFIANLANTYGFLAINNLLVGPEAEIRKLQEEDISIDPPKLSAEAKRLICTKYGLREEAGKWVGPLEVLSDAVGEVEESRVKLPQRVTALDMKAMLRSYPVKIEEGMIIGPRNSVREANDWLRVQDSIRVGAVLPAAHSPAITFEPWFQHQQEACVIKTLAKTDPEYVEITKKMGLDAPYRVASIQRIFNKKQYFAFMVKRRSIMQATGLPDLVQMELFHGSRKFNPGELMGGEDGLKYRFGSGGWGFGFYFAEKVLKAIKYGYRPPARPGEVQIFLCSVTTGRSTHIKSNRLLRKPPQEPGQLPFQSVEGNGGSHIVYESEMAYLKYLITVLEPKDPIKKK